MWWIAQNMLVSALLAAAVAVLCRVRRLSPAMKHAFWLLVLVKLVTPPLAYYRLPRSVERLVAAWTWAALADDEQPESESAPTFGDDLIFAGEAIDFTQSESGDPLPLDSNSADVAEIASTGNLAMPRDTTVVPVRSRVSIVPSEDAPSEDLPAAMTSEAAAERAGMLIWAVWLLGAAPLATLHMVRLIRLWRLTRRSAPVPVWLDRLAREAAQRLGVQKPMLIVVPRACSPLVYALGRSRLIWPAALNEQLTRQQQQAVLLHELAHLRRRDHWVAWLELVAGWLWWFNPVYWYARQQLREYAELACDAWVVGLLPAGRRTYAQALIEVTEFISSAPAALPALAMGHVARSSLERRLTMILRERISYRVPVAGAVVIGLALLAVLPGWSHGQAPDLAVGAPGGANADAPAVEPAIANSADAVRETAAQLADEGNVAAGAEAAADPSVPARVAEGDVDLGFPIAAANDQPAAGQTDVVAEPTGGDDERIAALEAKLAGLLAEVQALRGAKGKRGQKAAGRGVGGPMGAAGGMGRGGPMGPAGGMGMGGMGMGGPMGAGGGGGPMGPMGMGPGGGGGPMGPMGGPLGMGGTAAVRPSNNKRPTRHIKVGLNTNPPRTQLPADVETLTRARYKLSIATAEALTSFIHDHVKAHVEVVTDGGTITVTASQENQWWIAGFIEMLREPPEEPARSSKAKTRVPEGVPSSADEHQP